MKLAPIQENETERLKDLKSYNILDTPPQQDLQDITELAAAICGVPIAMCSLIDSNRQWFQSKIGTAVTETPRDISFCGHAINNPREMFVVSDAALDERFADNPLVTGDPHVRFYAGVPLVTPLGNALGTLCVVDRTPHVLSDAQKEALRILARQYMAQLELRKTVAKLVTAELTTQQTLHAIPDPLFVIDAEWKITFLNPAAEWLFLHAGYSLAKLPGQVIWDVLPQLSESAGGVVLRRVMETGKPERFQEFFQSFQIWLDVRATPGINGLTVLARDISAIHANQETLEKLNRELSITRDQALEANRAKSSFLANMSHELRTPLNGILGYTEILLHEPFEKIKDHFRPSLERIERSARHLLTLINDLLDMSKMEAGKLDFKPEPMDLLLLLTECITTLKPHADKNKNSILLEPRGELEYIEADPTRVRQIILNLLSNACKFTHSGTITVEFFMRVIAGHNWAVVRVSDTGIGIAQETMGKLFREFSQVDDGISRKYGGTGLGLAISRRLARMMGGDIEVVSAFGKGSTFTLMLPTQSSVLPPEAPGIKTIIRKRIAGLEDAERLPKASPDFKQDME